MLEIYIPNTAVNIILAPQEPMFGELGLGWRGGGGPGQQLNTAKHRLWNLERNVRGLTENRDYAPETSLTYFKMGLWPALCP